jgi:hypothetical protein
MGTGRGVQFDGPDKVCRRWVFHLVQKGHEAQWPVGWRLLRHGRHSWGVPRTPSNYPLKRSIYAEIDSSPARWLVDSEIEG